MNKVACFLALSVFFSERSKRSDKTKVMKRSACFCNAGQIKAYRLADNQTNRLSDWDQDRLVAELMDLQSSMSTST